MFSNVLIEMSNWDRVRTSKQDYLVEKHAPHISFHNNRLAGCQLPFMVSGKFDQTFPRMIFAYRNWLHRENIILRWCPLLRIGHPDRWD